MPYDAISFGLGVYRLIRGKMNKPPQNPSIWTIGSIGQRDDLGRVYAVNTVCGKR